MMTGASLRDLIATVGRSLQQDILPQVADPVAAGNLRACIALLAHLEDRAEQERTVLIEDIADMRSLLRDPACAELDPAGSIAQLIATCAEHVDVPTAQLRAENLAHREATTTLVKAIRDHPGDAAIDALHGRLRACLARMQQREYAMMRGAEALPPI